MPIHVQFTSLDWHRYTYVYDIYDSLPSSSTHFMNSVTKQAFVSETNVV